MIPFVTFNSAVVKMDCFGNCYEGAKKGKNKRSYRTDYITQAVARATLPLDVCHSRFGGGKSEIKRRVWQKGHRAEGNAESGKRKRKLERGEIIKEADAPFTVTNKNT